MYEYCNRERTSTAPSDVLHDRTHSEIPYDVNSNRIQKQLQSLCCINIWFFIMKQLDKYCYETLSPDAQWIQWAHHNPYRPICKINCTFETFSLSWSIEPNRTESPEYSPRFWGDSVRHSGHSLSQRLAPDQCWFALMWSHSFRLIPELSRYMSPYGSALGNWQRYR